MFRGAIEYIGEDTVSGWVYSPDAAVKGRVLLAFAGDECVGSGKVATLRQDLKEAGLGDGYCGFSFALRPRTETDAPITIRFEGTDAVLLPPDSDLVRRLQPPRLLSQEEFELRLAQLDWQSEHAVLKSSEFVLLRDLLTAGYCSRDLPGTGQGAKLLEEALGAYRAILSLAMQAHVDVTSLTSDGNLIASLGRVPEHGGFAPIVALVSEAGLALKVSRASHRKPVDDGEGAASLVVPVKLRGPRMLLLDSRLSILEVLSEKGPTHLLVGRLKR